MWIVQTVQIKWRNLQKLHMDICGINKKYKLELANPTVNEVADWVGRIKN